MLTDHENDPPEEQTNLSNNLPPSNETVSERPLLAKDLQIFPNRVSGLNSTSNTAHMPSPKFESSTSDLLSPTNLSRTSPSSSYTPVSSSFSNSYKTDSIGSAAKESMSPEDTFLPYYCKEANTSEKY